jgi:hypothetical protein
VYVAEHPTEEVYAYAESENAAFQVVDEHHSTGIYQDFVDAYYVLKNLSGMTEIRDDEKNTFVMLDNDSTHDVTMLQEPEYEPREVVDNTAYDAEHADRFELDGQTLQVDYYEDYMHYQSNMAAFIQLGYYFDYLREQGVYDNTRIILVSDHGWNGDVIDGSRIADGTNTYSYNCLMMVKDFGAAGFTSSDEFMTNADTPTLAMDGLISNPVNPYTGNAVNADAKQADEMHCFGDGNINIKENNGYRFEETQWYGLKNHNALDKNNWYPIDDPSK